MRKKILNGVIIALMIGLSVLFGILAFGGEKESEVPAPPEQEEKAGEWTNFY